MECIGNEFVRLGKRQQEMLNEIRDVVKPLHKMLAEKDEIIAEKDEVIKMKDGLVAEKDEIIKMKDERAAEKDEMIKKLVSDKERVIQQERGKFEEERKEYWELLSGMRVE